MLLWIDNILGTLFDMKQLFQNEGFTQEIKAGFLFRLLSSDRSIQDILFPNLQDQRLAMINQFAGMSEQQFTTEEYEFVRESMIKKVQNSLTEEDKLFILAFKNVAPGWSTYNFEAYPSIKWKQLNLEKMKANNSAKHNEMYNSLKRKLNEI